MSTIMKAISWRATRAAIPIAAALALPALLASCADSPTIPLARVSREITSGTVPGGQRALFFLTRAMSTATFAGTFDPTLNPQVLVCSEPRCVTPVLGPIALGSAGAARLTLDTVQQAYVFHWQTKRAPLAPNAVYRLVVRVGDYQLGWVDLATGTKQRDLRTINQREFVPLRLGSTLTLPFRIEQGAPFPPDVPGRYESAPDACAPEPGCLFHADPYFDYLAVWGAVQITQTGIGTVGFLAYASDRINPPVIPPIPAPGTGPVNEPLDPNVNPTIVSWRPDESDPCLELWVDGLLWGHWCGTSGGPATISADFEPFDVLGGFNRLPNYLPPID